MSDLVARFSSALAHRLPRLSEPHTSALRLFNGYTEGFPRVAVDLYGTTLVLHDATSAAGDRAGMIALIEHARVAMPWITAALWKRRESANQDERNGTLLFGTGVGLTRKVQEDGVWYTTRLTLNRDASFYLDTAPLRAWAKRTLKGKRVLNAFAYTGSLGVAAMAGGAESVLHNDLNNAFLTVAKDSYALNRFPVARKDFWPGDFFDVIGRLKKEPLFDCIFVDPPFFSVTEKGRVDLEQDMVRLLNKVRPLVAHGGFLVAINNGVFVSGADFMKAMDAVCTGGYLAFGERIDVPEEFVGYPGTKQGALPVDPAPFNHSTKMAVLNVTRKDGRTR
ncbi:MAG: class I SAM-dependent methyltransferase [Archangium sp.]|nr:class I SAM-dependent methyltransferase [Archangium sp.]MDP3151205.1 class I SAM-dependent methyltransferase [Archangium sp.]MDP3570154.1 class I SAM-dependent methyltransferase [Archangium sp.]